MTMLRLSNVRYTYPGRLPLDFPNCVLETGDVAALVGPSTGGGEFEEWFVLGIAALWGAARWTRSRPSA